MARSSVASLLEENRQLRVQLERSDVARRRVEGQVTEMQRRVSFAETTAAQQLRLKEGEWMAEYDRSVQALLMIIKHHEEEMARVEMEVQQLRAAAGDIPSPTTKMTRSTQTEVLRPTTSRRNSVRFAEEEDGTTLEKEERAYIDAKAKSNLVRMQRLFEQLQVPRDRPVDLHSTVAKNTRLSIARDHAEHSPASPNHDLKSAVLERLQGIQTAASAGRRQSSVIATSSMGKSKSTDTQTDEVPVPRQDTCSATVQQDLKERNRLLHERLTSQQKVLDELLYTKLKNASAGADNALRGHSQSSPSISSDSMKVIDQADDRNKCDSPVPTTGPRACLAQRSAICIDAAGTTERRPLSPPAA